MASPASILAEIHRLRTYARDLQERIDRAPRQAKAQQNVIAKREEELKHGQDVVKKLKVGIHDHDVSIIAAQDQIKKYEKQLSDITSKKEYDALRHEIAGVKERIKGIEEETLASMLELEAKTGLLPALEEAVKKAKAEAAQLDRENQGQLETWRKERDQSIEKTAVEEAKLTGDVRVQYDRLIKAMGADALSHVEGKNCAACYTDMTETWYHNVLKRQFVMCRNCGRMLYLKD